MADIVQHTITASLAVQFAALVISLLGLGVPIATGNLVLRSILGMEAVVQVVEMIFYTWFGVFFRGAAARMDIARYRYFDWFFTTPIMLLSTMMFFTHRGASRLPRPPDGTQKGSARANVPPAGSGELAEPIAARGVWAELRNIAATGWKFARENARPVAVVLGSNALMLLFGFLREIGKIGLGASQVLGFGFFGLCFYTLYTNFVVGSHVNYGIYFTMLALWSLYGVAALYRNKVKNTAYNILDMFSKNFYSVFIAWYIYSLQA